ncbi:MAG: ribosome recycling factor [Candidatus Staskawiczbacteria bacterium RIFCSPHIGHO2_02_FULL_34_10]|uniref:Ribosome recycling factor n=2 Tax=Candidatus Staskawicziibacteriota TaxID=1817916 RepID=A0A1G2HJ06_9BACT|nr:MAG: ribosome recycling factor [Candidatus Staskawiczbacteria bacterium RIFCSPHIGHO2_01_FULL_34_27]OGZ66361.1 MAG: ribosome recycling factor [Candidatus Staskawiczbacteria bacterium RIFCSPHIGHO2_02_FULL_34_10]
MTYKEFIDKARPEFEKAFKFLEAEITKIRTSRASPALIEDIEVNCFGNKFPLKQLAAISCPQPNQIVIQPWDNSYIEPIEKAISQSGLGMSLAVDKNLVRLSLPLLTEEYRHSLTKILSEKSEQARQTMRHFREDAWNRIQVATKEKQLSEDDKFRGKDQLQKLIDEYSKKIKELVERKEKELM